MPVTRDTIEDSRVIGIRYSKDGGYNWSGWTPRSLGVSGDHAVRVRRYRLGQGRQWTFEIRTSAYARVDVIGMAIQAVTEG